MGVNLGYHDKETILLTLDPCYVKGINFSHHNKETILVAIDPVRGNLN